MFCFSCCKFICDTTSAVVARQGSRGPSDLTAKAWAIHKVDANARLLGVGTLTITVRTALPILLVLSTEIYP